MSEYIIVVAYGSYKYSDLQRKVNSKIKQNYQPIGGVCASDTYLYQAMIYVDPSAHRKA